MGTIQISGKVIYGEPAGMVVGVAGAVVRIIDQDRGGNGDDEILVTTTDARGHFDGVSRDWVDRNDEKVTMRVPGLKDRVVTVEAPDRLALKIRIEYEAKIEEYPYLQMPGRAVVRVLGTAPQFVLPAADQNPTLRTAWLAAQRAQYAWQRSSGGPLPHVQGHPLRERPPQDYVGRRLAVEGTIAGAYAQNEASLRVDPINSIAEYARLTAPLSPPSRPSAVDDDIEFARQRVAGVNPLVIERWTSPRAGCHLADAHLQSHGLTVQQATDQGRLFVCDYALLAKTDVTAGRFFPAPFALFLAVPTGPGGRSELTPIGIQVERQINDEARTQMITPGQTQWKVAKTAVQMADLNLHELKSHLFECHLTMESLAVAAARNMASNHPIFELLRVHFNLLIHQNVAARLTLVNDGGSVDALLGTGIAGARQIMTRCRDAWSFRGAALRTNLENRGISTRIETQVTYPYRDDALLIWDTIGEHVTRWVRLFYSNDAAVRDDKELQGWRNEAMDPTLGALGELPQLDGQQALADMLTQIIFTCTAQHSAVNYPQYSFMASVPSMPASLRGDWKEQKEPYFILPRDALANSQVKLAADLSLFQYDHLGDYPAYNGAALQELVIKFRRALDKAKTTINDRNQATRRRRAYEALLPANIANSISI